MKSKLIVALTTNIYWREYAGVFVMGCPALNLDAEGKTEEEAELNLRVAIELRDAAAWRRYKNA